MDFDFCGFFFARLGKKEPTINVKYHAAASESGLLLKPLGMFQCHFTVWALCGQRQFVGLRVRWPYGGGHWRIAQRHEPIGRCIAHATQLQGTAAFMHAATEYAMIMP